MSSSAQVELSLTPVEPLSRHTSLKVGGPAEQFCPARAPEQALAALALAEERGWPVLVIGGGSNLLPADEGVAGLVVKYVGSSFEVEAGGDRVVCRADAGCGLAGLARRLARDGWAGLEWAVNVPGTVGGAAVNNAGAFGSCVAECLRAVEFVDARGRQQRLEARELGYEYRSSRLKRREMGALVVLRAEFELRASDRATLKEIVERNQEQRTRTQPRQLSAGSVFANPHGDFAGRLIEAAGLKGSRIGGAQISPQHANFIVNVGRASARDVYALVRSAQLAVWQRSGLWLRPEIELVGRWPGEDRAALEGPSDGATEPRGEAET